MGGFMLRDACSLIVVVIAIMIEIIAMSRRIDDDPDHDDEVNPLISSKPHPTFASR